MAIRQNILVPDTHYQRINNRHRHILINSDSRDFTILMNKLSEEQVKRMEESNNRNRQLFSVQPYLKLKVDEDMAAL